jgi:hypothetical protein
MIDVAQVFKKAVRNLETADWGLFVEIERRQLAKLMWVPRTFSEEHRDMPYRMWANVRGGTNFSILRAS